MTLTCSRICCHLLSGECLRGNSAFMGASFKISFSIARIGLWMLFDCLCVTMELYLLG